MHPAVEHIDMKQDLSSEGRVASSVCLVDQLGGIKIVIVGGIIAIALHQVE